MDNNLVRPYSRLRLILELIGGAILIVFIFGLMTAAALAVSPFMLLGMLIPLLLEVKHRLKHNT